MDSKAVIKQEIVDCNLQVKAIIQVRASQSFARKHFVKLIFIAQQI